MCIWPDSISSMKVLLVDLGLCMEPAKKYTHVDKLSEDEYALLLEVESTSIDQSACIFVTVAQSK